MDIFKLIHKIRNLSVDDKIYLAKKTAITFIILVLSIAFIITGFKIIKKVFNFNTKEEITHDTSEEEIYMPSGKEFLENEVIFEPPTSKQKDEFKIYDCLQFSDIKQKDGIVSFNIKNVSDFEIKSVSIDLYNSKNQLITTLTSPLNTTIKPNQEIMIEGFASEEVRVRVYSYFKEDDYITINLDDKSALTDENYEGEVF